MGQFQFEILWSKLGPLASAKLVSSMYIWLIVVPVLAKALSNVCGPVSLNIFGHQFGVNLDLPFTWQIFYFSAVLFTLANIVFYFRSPRIIKDHATASEFREAGKGWNQLLSYRDDAGYPKDEFKRISNFLKGNATDPDDKYHKMHNPENRYYELFWVVYNYANSSKKCWLLVCAGLYSLGLILIAFVFIQNLIVVLRTSEIL